MSSNVFSFYLKFAWNLSLVDLSTIRTSVSVSLKWPFLTSLKRACSSLWSVAEVVYRVLVMFWGVWYLAVWVCIYLQFVRTVESSFLKLIIQLSFARLILRSWRYFLSSCFIYCMWRIKLLYITTMSSTNLLIARGINVFEAWPLGVKRPMPDLT